MSRNPKENLSKLPLRKDVKPLLDLPATKEDIDVYMVPSNYKQLREPGVDMKKLTEFLKSKSVGIQAVEADTITDVRFDKDRVEIHIGGAGEGRRGSNRADKVNGSFLGAGGSRINFHYGWPLTDADLDPATFLRLMSRVLEVLAIRQEQAVGKMPAEFNSAIKEQMVREGMTYKMVLLTFGDPGQKKINDSSTRLSETWYYLKDGHHWVIDFTDSNVSQVRVH